MIDWWSLFHNGLWVGGLAVALAALSVAYYSSRREGVSLRRKLGQSGFLLPFNLGLALFCLGLFMAGESWWERLVWAGLAVLFAAQVIWAYWERRQEVAWERQQVGPEQVSRRRSRLALWLGWGLVFTGLLILVVDVAVTGVQLARHVQSLRAGLQHLEQLAPNGVSRLDPAGLEEAGQRLSAARMDLEAIQAQVGWLLPVGRLLAWVPRHGGDLAAASDLMQAASGVTIAGDRAFQALSPALELLDDGQGGLNQALGMGEQLVPVLSAAQPELGSAKQALTAAGQARQRIGVSSLSPQVAGLVQQLDRYLLAVEMVVDGALLAPDLLGANGPRTYLVLAQNNQELRATGGFISGVGELRVEGGELMSLSFSDSYAVDNHNVPHDVTPPEFQNTLVGQLWFFRDANWDADFPTSARRVLDIYARDRDVEADGVIALDLAALGTLVDAVGPMQVEGIEETVKGDNVLEVIQAQWSGPAGGAGRDWWLQRKDFMGQIATAAMDRLLTGQRVKPARLAQVVLQALREKHILVYLTDPQAAELLRTRNWDGAVAVLPEPQDTLLVVDSNVGFNKVDPNVDRSIRYQVDLSSEEGPRAHLTLTYHNRSGRLVQKCIQESRYGGSYADMMERCYWDYVRVYVPAGSLLLAGPDLPFPSGSLLARNSDVLPREPIAATLNEGDRSVWAVFFDLPPGEKRTLTFDFQLPAWVLDREVNGLTRYRLRVQKQPGTGAVPLQVDIVLPSDAELVTAVPDDLTTIVTDLREDREFEVVYRRTEVGR